MGKILKPGFSRAPNHLSNTCKSYKIPGTVPNRALIALSTPFTSLAFVKTDIKLVLLSYCLTYLGRKGKSRKEEERMRYKKKDCDIRIIIPILKKFIFFLRNYLVRDAVCQEFKRLPVIMFKVRRSNLNGW